MDPNTLLQNLRDVRDVLDRALGNKLETETASERLATQEVIENAAEELVTMIKDLDEWITSGGFLPSDWTMDKRN